MKKVLVTIVGLMFCAGLMISNAGEKKQLTDEQKAEMKKLTEKYDANKDGKIDKEERAKMSQEDKDAMSKIMGGGKKKGKKE